MTTKEIALPSGVEVTIRVPSIDDIGKFKEESLLAVESGDLIEMANLLQHYAVDFDAFDLEIPDFQHVFEVLLALQIKFAIDLTEAALTRPDDPEDLH